MFQIFVVEKWQVQEKAKMKDRFDVCKRMHLSKDVYSVLPYSEYVIKDIIIRNQTLIFQLNTVLRE